MIEGMLAYLCIVIVNNKVTANKSMQQFQGASMGYAASMGETQSAGLAGFVGGGGGGLPEQRQAQTLTPVTIKMLQDAVKQQKNSGPQPGGMDAAYMVNGKDLGMLTLVACVESVQETQSYKNYQVNDGTARMSVQYYNDVDALVQDIRPGAYVRIFGHLRSWQGSEHISAHHVVQIENANEIPYHFIEVTHVHLSLLGKLVKAPPQAATATTAGQTTQSTVPAGFHMASAPAPQGHGQPATAPVQAGLPLFGGTSPYGGGGGGGPYGAAPGGGTGQVGGISPYNGGGGSGGPYGAAPGGGTGQVGNIGGVPNPYGDAQPATGTLGGAGGGCAGGGQVHPWRGGGLFGDQRPGGAQAGRPASGGIDLFG